MESWETVPRVETGERESDRRAGFRTAALVVAALVWLIAFGCYFFSQTLPNNSDFARSAILLQTPELLLEQIVPTETPAGMSSGWRFFPQRFDLLLIAGIIWTAAWALGRLILRLLGVSLPMPASGRLALATGVGLAAWSLATLGLGLCGLLERWLFAALMVAAVVAEIAVGIGGLRRSKAEPAAAEGSERAPLLTRRFLRGSRVPALVVLAVLPFLLAMLLGAMLPPAVDFDEKEYHLQGPKEWYLQGEISFLPHNVYTSFPFLTEMLTLLAMVLRGDWYRGGMAGRTVLMGFAPLTALALHAAAVITAGGTSTEGTDAPMKRRMHALASTAGWLAAFVFLTTPWVHRISVIAYAEGGLTFYLTAAFLCVLMVLKGSGEDGIWNRGMLVLTGLTAGSAMACKYPGVLSVVIPLGACLIWLAMRGAVIRPGESRWKAALRAGGLYSVGVVIAFGPWALKNTAQTGNPVYPLLYSVLGGADWDDELNAKWKAGHSPPLHLLEEPAAILPDLTANALSVAVRSDWQSPLVFGGGMLTVLVLLSGGSGASSLGRVVLGAMLYVVWLFLTWWSFTHRIDRFWVPMLPVVCLLAGLGLAEMFAAIERLSGRLGEFAGVAAKLTLGLLLVTATAYNLAFATSRLTGYNAFLLDHAEARRQATTRSIALVNRAVPQDARVLLVGEAEVFDAEFEPIYNTVFDRSIFEELCTDDGGRMLSSEEIRERLQGAEIGYVFVNWLEILRYREPGSYGYTDFVSPSRINGLVEGGVLEEVPLGVMETTVFVEQLSPGKQQEVERWGAGLRTSLNFRPAIRVYALYRVVGDQANWQRMRRMRRMRRVDADEG